MSTVIAQLSYELQACSVRNDHDTYIIVSYSLIICQCCNVLGSTLGFWSN